MTTWEVQEIIEWFKQLSNDIEPHYRLMTFTEPNLSFELLNNFTDKQKLIRMKFDLESRPKSASGDKEYYVDISADNGEIKEIIKGLKYELDKYPEREPTT